MTANRSTRRDYPLHSLASLLTTQAPDTPKEPVTGQPAISRTIGASEIRHLASGQLIVPGAAFHRAHRIAPASDKPALLTDNQPRCAVTQELSYLLANDANCGLWEREL